ADAFDYIALGHLHGQQRVGAEHIRYAGSPLKYSFSECAHKKAALLVELREKGSLAITPLPLEPVRDMRKIRGPLAELLSEAVAKAANPEDYLHVTLTDEDEISDAIGKLRAVYPNVMALTFDNKRARAEPALGGASDLPGAQPLPLFEAFYLAQNGTEIKERQLAAVRRLLDARPAE
ncbi:MAG: exonuclease SbcCD subunit D C-terminal domain-containing protein, partial [Clostridiales bacterium]|nr:exonuclease SbcCD subunit D C-terminal domain-containing protein [Clostridiales bacterium]